MMAAGRILGIKEYGALGALFALCAIGDVWRTAIQLDTTTKITHGHTAASTQHTIIKQAALVVAATTATAIPLSHALSIGNPAACALCGTYVGAGALFANRRGTLLASGQRKQVAVAVIANSITRIIFTICGALIAGVSGAIIASMAAELVGAICCSTPGGTTPTTRHTTTGTPDHTTRRRGTLLLICALAASPPGLDGVAARTILPEHQGGQYAAAAAIARGILGVGQLLVVATIPDLIANPEQTLRRSWNRIIAPIAALATSAAVTGPAALSILAGDEFASAATISLMAVCATAATISMLICYTAHTAGGTRPATLFANALSGAALWAAISAIWHPHTATSLAATAALAATLQAATAWATVRKHPNTATTHQGHS